MSRLLLGGELLQSKDLIGIEEAAGADLEAEVVDAAEGDARELDDLQPDGVAHPVDLARAALADRHDEPLVRAGELEQVHLRRQSLPPFTVETHALPQPL